ncbi:DUF983 domain-containing protein [Roseomonas populi]|uniref:DUF983 domain-containing protein n=1 Tax=Roseomonas populi TaxID=3121582 RepID=A0ABT1WZJ3_9PROT|nr:DUF983 domain-containing protein [Roseomonas pecuniae]MCR0981260.1 DUF983 domain-containing protein [Roseomonas pecuniae]
MPSPQAPPEPTTVSWRPAPVQPEAAERGTTMLGAIRRGIVNRCPNCGEGPVFQGFLRVAPECRVCHAPLGSLRADDAPPYIVIFLAGHLLIPPIFWIEKAYEPPMWLHMVVWLPLFAVICTLLLRPVKGGVVGWMWKLGFADPGSPHGESAPGPGSSRDV